MEVILKTDARVFKKHRLALGVPGTPRGGHNCAGRCSTLNCRRRCWHQDSRYLGREKGLSAFRNRQFSLNAAKESLLARRLYGCEAMHPVPWICHFAIWEERIVVPVSLFLFAFACHDVAPFSTSLSLLLFGFLPMSIFLLIFLCLQLGWKKSLVVKSTQCMLTNDIFVHSA